MGEEGYERVFGKQVVKLKRLGADGQVLRKSGIKFNVYLMLFLSLTCLIHLNQDELNGFLVFPAR